MLGIPSKHILASNVLPGGICLELVQTICRLAGWINESADTAPRYLLTFPKRKTYEAVAARIREELQSQEGWKRVTFLPLAGAIRLPLDEPKLLMNTDDLILEPDRILTIDTKYFLPHTGKTSLSYDPAHRIPWGVADVCAPKLWRKTKGAHVRIGVVDTGVDYEHPDIRDALHTGVNIINRHLSAADDNGHGTHIAGTIAASSTAGKINTGIYGVAPKARIFPVKAFDKDGSAYVSDIILAIHWCIANKINIINMSFGMSEYSPSLYQAVKAAYRRNVIIVASSGNNGHENAVDYPAKMPHTIAVGAINKRKKVAAFSNQGMEVDIYAPGEAIYSTWPGYRYNELNGTSMAAAHVSGVLALLLSRKPGLTYTQIKKIIVGTAVPLTKEQRHAGAPGRLNAVRAWSRLTTSSVKQNAVPTKKHVRTASR